MFRSTQPLWAGSARAIAASRQLSLRSATNVPSLAQSATRVPRAGTSLVLKTRYTTKPPLGESLKPEEIKKAAEQKLESHPEQVSTESSVRHAFEPAPEDAQKDVADGLGHDIHIVKETFNLAQVPRESYILGLSGTIPYLATSVSVVYLSWASNTDWPTTSTVLNHMLMSHENAHYFLSLLEPIQVGYGAAIISFLGAIHWGLEYAEKAPDAARTRFRYGLGVAAPLVAWPTLLMPWPWALTTQWAAFVGLWLADRTASIRGWAPYWYATYRFVLTAIVGVAIMISMIGTMKVGQYKPQFGKISEKIQENRFEEPYTEKWQQLEKPAYEEERVKKEKAEAEQKKKEEEEAKQKEKEEKEKKEEEAKKAKEEAKNKDKKGDKKEDKKDDKKDEKKDDKQEEKKDENKDDKKDEKEEKKDDKSEEQTEGKGDDKKGEDKKEGEKKE
ncbi:hypothetical protein PG994_001071 [Apiospora phragmitis]|uniref:Mitochondrial inner membrane protein 1 n=1 Tax=Apiospora phragmitis TaxID=2905665 RepID=A0ABR1WSG1_9PEZI